ncbi:MAG: hypothetical protein LBS37_02220 [Treponema sp.]|jgi:hypothetical protein|nr:hypothetical protein [Treponema sp.]
MEKYLLYILLIAALANANAQNRAPNDGQAAYYKQTGVVRNGARTAGDNTGQFISFTFAGCYDSNNQRHEVGNGFLAYKGLQNDIHAYNGRSYWGENTAYYFSADFNRLNIYAPDGLIYVYEKASAPAGVATSAKIYVKPVEPRREENAVIAGPDPIYTDRSDNRQIIPPPPPSPPDHTAELRRMQERYTRLKQLKAREEQRLEDTYRPVIDSGIAKGYFDNRNSIRETIRLYERQMSDIQREARNVGGSVY